MEQHPIYDFARHYNPKLTDAEIKAKFVDGGKYLETLDRMRQETYPDLDQDAFLTKFHAKYEDLSKKKESGVSGVSSLAGSSYSWESGSPELAAKVSTPKTATSLSSGSSGKVTPDAIAASKRAEQELALQKARQRPNFEKAADLDDYTKQQVQGSILAPEKEYQARLNTLQSDSDNLQRAIEASEARIKEKWGDNWIADYNARIQALNNPETRTEELAKQQQEFEADQFVNERNNFITALEANQESGKQILKDDKYAYARALEDYDKKKLQKAEHAGWGNLTLGILQRSAGKLVGSVGEVMNIVENITTGDKAYGTWDKIEDFFIDFQDQTAKVAPRPTKYTRPLYTKTAKAMLNGEKVEVDFDGDKPSVVRNSKGMAIEADPTKLGELKPKNQFNSKGLIYQTGEVLADAMVQIATTKGIGGTLVKTGMGAKTAYAVGVTASTMGQMAGGLYDQGLKMFDGDKRKAAQYAAMTGLAIGAGSNLFGLEARLAGGPGVFDDLTMAQAAKGLTPKAAAARTATNFFKQGGGEMIEETIVEKGIEGATAMVLNGDAEDIDLNEMKGTALISFVTGALMSGADNDFKNTAWLVAAENPEEFKKALQAEVANGKKVDVEKMYNKALKIKGLSEIKEVSEEDVSKLDELTELKDKAEKAKAIGADAQAKVFKEQAEAKEVEVFKEKEEEIVIPEEEILLENIPAEIALETTLQEPVDQQDAIVENLSVENTNLEQNISEGAQQKAEDMPRTYEESVVVGKSISEAILADKEITKSTNKPEYVPIDDISQFVEVDRASDPRTSENVNELSKQIAKDGGVKEPIVLTVFKDKKAVITEGNHRVAAAKQLGIKSIPTRVEYSDKKSTDTGYAETARNLPDTESYQVLSSLEKKYPTSPVPRAISSPTSAGFINSRTLEDVIADPYENVIESAAAQPTEQAPELSTPGETDWTKSADTLALADQLSQMEEDSAENRMENEEGPGFNYGEQNKIIKELKSRGVAEEDIPFLSRVPNVDPEGYVANALGVDEVTEADYAEFDRKQKEVRAEYGDTQKSTSKEQESRQEKQRNLLPTIDEVNGFAAQPGFIGEKLWGVAMKSGAMNWLKKAWKYTFFGRGDLPIDVAQLNYRRIARIEGMMKQAELTSNKLKKLIKGKTPQQIEDLNYALQSTETTYADGRPIEPDVLDLISKMREHVKAMSSELINTGIADGKLAAIISKNLDTYLTRSYQIHFNKDWVKKVKDTAVYTRAKAFLDKKFAQEEADAQAKIAKYEAQKQIGNKPGIDKQIKTANNKIKKYEDNKKIAEQSVVRIDKKIAAMTDPNEIAAAQKRKTKKEERVKKWENATIAQQELIGKLNQRAVVGADEYWDNKIKNQQKRIGRDVEAELDSILEKQAKGLSLGDVAKSGSLGSMNLGVFKKRKDIAEEIRDVFGEVKDPIVNYMTSIFKTAHILENNKFLSKVEDEGKDKFLFERPTGPYTAQFPDTPQMGPLAGYYSTPEIVEAFRLYNKPIGDMTEEGDVMGLVYKSILGITSRAKSFMTIFSIASTSRNLVSNLLLQAQKGLFNVADPNIGKAISVLRGKNEPELIEMYSLGVLGDGITFGEIADVRKQYARRFAGIDKTEAGKLKSAWGHVEKFMSTLYQFGDEFYRAIDYYRNLDKMARLYKGDEYENLSPDVQEEVKLLAAERVSSENPTYSRLPRNIKALRRNPFVAPFPSFPYEMVRVSYNIMTNLIQDMKMGQDTKVNVAGVEMSYKNLMLGKVMAGSMAVSIAPFLLKELITNMLGWSDEDDERLKYFVPFYHEGSLLIPSPWNDKNGSVDYYDWGYMFPQGHILSTVSTVSDERFSPAENVGRAAEKFFEPFYSIDPLMKSLVEATYGQQLGKTGRPISQVGETGWLKARMEHIGKKLTPGTIKSFERVFRSFNEPETDYYGKLNPVQEGVAIFPGFRSYNVDIHRSFGFLGRNMAEKINDSKADYGVEKNKEQVKALPEKEREAHLGKVKEREMKDYEKFVMDFHEIYMAAIEFPGVDKNKIDESLKDLRLDAVTIRGIMTGEVGEPEFFRK